MPGFVHAIVFAALAPTARELASQLHEQLLQLPPFMSADAKYQAAAGVDDLARQPALTRLVAGPLSQLSMEPGTRIRIIIDGLDELPTAVIEELVDAIAPPDAGTTSALVRVLLTARPELLNRFPAMSALGTPLVVSPPTPAALAAFSRAHVPTEQIVGVISATALHGSCDDGLARPRIPRPNLTRAGRLFTTRPLSGSSRRWVSLPPTYSTSSLRLALARSCPSRWPQCLVDTWAAATIPWWFVTCLQAWTG